MKHFLQVSTASNFMSYLSFLSQHGEWQQQSWELKLYISFDMVVPLSDVSQRHVILAVETDVNCA